MPSLDSGDPFPGNSKNTYNVTGYFENALFSARLAYTLPVQLLHHSSTAPRDLNEAALKSLDASFAWNVTKWAAITLEART